jgi:hypothetical protein
MKTFLMRLMPLLLAVQLLSAGDATYRLEFQIRGSAISRLLLVLPLRVFYDASAAIDLTAHSHVGGVTCFSYAGVPRPAYILRTLGFSGKTLALLTVGWDDDAGEPFAGELISQWRRQELEFAAKVKKVKKFPHRLAPAGPQSFVFERDDSGCYQNIFSDLEAQYVYFPSKTGIFFNVFPMLADLLTLLNHRFAPAAMNGPSSPLPEEWTGDALDLSGDLNRVAGLMEKAVKSLVTVRQKSPFHLSFRVTSSSPEAIEICGECFPDVSIWKGFMIREMFRRVRWRPADRALLEDEVWISVRNSKGHGGFGRLRLKLIN